MPEKLASLPNFYSKKSLIRKSQVAKIAKKMSQEVFGQKKKKKKRNRQKGDFTHFFISFLIAYYFCPKKNNPAGLPRLLRARGPGRRVPGHVPHQLRHRAPRRVEGEDGGGRSRGRVARRYWRRAGQGGRVCVCVCVSPFTHLAFTAGLPNQQTVACKVEAQSEHVRVACTLLARSAPICTLSRCLLTKNFCTGAQEEAY